MEMLESALSVVHKVKLLFDHKEDDPEAEAIILYPSFGAPLLAKPGQTLQLYVLFERKLFFLYRDELASDPQLTKTIKVINKSLKIFPWKDGKKNPRKRLFPSDGTAKSNIRCTYLKLLTNRSLEDKEGKLFAYLRKKTNDVYAKHEKGFRYLFLLEIQNLGLSPGVHDCAWQLYDAKSPANSLKPPLPFPERQDLMAREFIAKGKNDRHFIKQESGYKIEKKFNFDKDDDLSLSNHHVIYISAKPKLNIGQLTDIHVSSRQMAYTVCEAQVLPTADTQWSPKIGTQVNASFETFKDLLDKMGSDSNIDLLVLTGDLIDFNQNFDPTVVGKDWRQTFKRPAELWKWMDPQRFDDEGEGQPPYPYFIDMLTIYSLMRDFVKTHNKPIVMLTGNHEAYDQPYGVSPRLGQFWGNNPEGVMRANDGIPADHNLTTYEATLLYGPLYYDYRKTHNFVARHLEWFYMMFNPLSDFTITHGEQSFTALEWQDGEKYIENKLRGGGTLPRATEAVSDEQLKLLQESSRRGQDRVLLTHFTIVSYGYAYQITKEGEVNYNNDSYQSYVASATDFVPYVGHLPGAAVRIASDWTHVGSRMSEYEEGTFVQNRKAVYNMLYDGSFTHVFSGHSHRAGYYVMTERTGLVSSNVKVRGYPIQETARSLAAPLQGGKAHLIVGASGGPIPGQNHYASLKEKGLSNWSLDIPSGNVFDFNKDTLYLKTSGLDTAKPRFAVALSFFNDLKEPVFQTFESGNVKPRNRPIQNMPESEFVVEIHPDLPGEQFIEGMTMQVFQEGKWSSYTMSVAGDGERQSKSTFKSMSSPEAKTKIFKEVGSRYFLRITFNKSLAAKTGYKQYNFDSPWIFPIQLIDKKAIVEEQARIVAARMYDTSSTEVYLADMVARTSGYRIKVSSKVPDFVWYQKNFDRYSTGKPTSPSKDKEPGYTR